MTDDLNRALGRLEGKLDQVLARQSETHTKLEANSVRLSNVESDLSATKSVGAMAALAVTAIATVFPSFFPGHK